MALDFPSAPSNGDTYAGYIYESARGVWLKQAPGIVQNDAPNNPTTGQFWYDQDDAILYVYDGSQWLEAGGSSGGASLEVGSTAPESPSNGSLWWDSDNGNLYIYYDDGTTQQWVAANGPQVFVGTSAPAGYQGQLWFDSNEGKTYIYYDDGTSGQWVSAIGGSLSGNVIQVVSTTKTDVFTSSSGSFVDITGLAATITPRDTNSKILVSVTLGQVDANALERLVFGITRNSTQIAQGDQQGTVRVSASSVLTINSSSVEKNAVIQYLDSPASSSALTYQVTGACISTGTFSVNGNAVYADQTYFGNAISTITVMEIAG